MTSEGFRILMVEDDADDVELTRKALKDAKFLVDLRVAGDGFQALRMLLHEGEYADSASTDLVLLDLNLPGMDGREVLRRIKGDDRTKHIPVIILTTSGADEDVLKSYQLHANSYVRKPIGLQTFVHAVRVIEEFWLTVAKLPPRDRA